MGALVGAAVVGACVWTMVFIDISVVDDASLTVAAARELLVGEFNSIDSIVFDRVLLETAVVSSDTSSALSSPEACPAIGEITRSNDTLELCPERRSKCCTACKLITCSAESTAGRVETRAICTTSCAAVSLLKASGSNWSTTSALETITTFVGAIVGAFVGQ